MKKLSVLVFILAAAGLAAAQEWHFETVDPGDSVGLDSSVVLDAYGFPHISYTDCPNWDVKYAYWNGSSWQTETVQSDGMVFNGSLALDSYGYPHISYYDGMPNYDLRYAHYDVWGWHYETLDTSGTTGVYSSIAMDSSNFPHIAYFFSTSANLKYASRDADEWHLELIDWEGDVGYYPSLVIGDDDCPHVAYADNDGPGLKYAYWDSDEWRIETVVSGMGVYSPSLALDSEGNPHIAYFIGYSNENLEYAYRDGGGWHIDVVESWYADSISLALDSSDLPHISYRRSPDDYLKYARWDGDEWQISTLDSSRHVGEGTSIAIDSDDYPHISFYLLGNLMHAWYGYGPAVEDVELFTNVSDEGVLIGWEITGDLPAGMCVLRSVGEGEPMYVSGALPGTATRYLDRIDKGLKTLAPGIGYRYWLEVVEEDGTVSLFGPTEAVTFPGAARELSLDVYPSPAADSVTVEYTLPEDGRVTVCVYDLSGRRVATLVDTEQTAGRHVLVYDPSSLPPGVYLAHLEIDAGSLSRRVVVSR